MANVTDLSGMPNDTELWIPISHSHGFDNRRGHHLSVMARLKPGVTIQHAQAEMDQIAIRLMQQARRP